MPATSSASQSPSASRPGLYVPQFSAATQMILKRMKNEAAGLSSGLSAVNSSQPEIKPEFKPSEYEDVKRRVIMGMSTSASMTLQMPAAPRPTPPPPPPPTYVPHPHVGYVTSTAPSRPKMASGAAGLSAIRRVTLGLTASGRPIAPKPAQPSTPTMAEPKEKKFKAASAPKAGTKRKRGAPRAHDDDTSSLSSLSGLSDNEDGPDAKPSTPSAPPILTKSGRHVQKPTTYNPAEMESSSAKKRVHHSKVRTAEQALCKKCTRMHSPASNQMVFCDGCNEGWHQRCHDPWIYDEVVKDPNEAWFCATCKAKRDRQLFGTGNTNNHPPKRQKVAVREGWADRTPQQKRAYLSTLPQQELVGLLMYSLEIHPDLPIFPGTAEAVTTPSTPGTPQTPSDAHGTGRKGGRAQKGGKGAPAPQQQHQDNDDDVDPLEPPWPKSGYGLYSLLPPEDDDEYLADENDFEAFSVIVYDEKGKKIEENGIKVVLS
ncbi:hypothetical protein CONLIGDRAFT_629310 [Coniochaeta ligniaria NRRL 30616]|uniref:PHD-type domain-containing protein n=1 Tax=Coniochaeta ligniaria NRRL 30616 TaxID=1408157 RepID=A0A1J7IVC0_9PEZI|nr:hypothetical protein CONLIGDRAFT_629310 [Coniochaeta ligniaria NRRL 30616]